MTSSRPEVRELLARHALRPSRALGQNFVADANTVRRIARLAGVGPGDRVVEIGAGLGALTLALADTGAQVTAVELDRRLIPVLRELLESRPVQVIEADALTLDWPALLGAPAPRASGAPGPRASGTPDTAASDAAAWTVVGNLPYNVAVPVVLRVLDEAPAVASMLVMVQREVGERLAAPPGGKAYGSVSVHVAYHALARVVGRVPASVFIPRPKVESVLVRFERRAQPAVDVEVVAPEELFALVRAGFAHRRKMLRRSLSGLVPMAAFTAAGVSPEARAESLAVEDWGEAGGVCPRRRSRVVSAARGDGAPLVGDGGGRQRVGAPAKLTLSLRVTGVRADGFHLLDAEMVSISLADELVFSPGSGLTVVDEVPGGLGVAHVPAGADNLVERALRAVGRRAAVQLHKRIPTGAGLGGGSADAAAVLRWAGARHDDVAVRLGADVPFCVAGGRARVTGIGEMLHPLAVEERHFVILVPPIFVDTAAVYRAWDEQRAGGAVPSDDDGAALDGNDLESPALAVQPALAQWKERFADVTGLRPRLAGSGSAWFVEGTPAQVGLEGVAFVALGEMRAPVVAVSTVPSASTESTSVEGG